jgi:membrane fusion protein (multidrug efflux system)
MQRCSIRPAPTSRPPKATVDAKQAVLETQQSVIAAARASIDIDEANEPSPSRTTSAIRLAVSGYAPVQSAQQAASQITANQCHDRPRYRSLEGAIRHVDLLKAELAQAKAMLARDLAVQRQAELNLSYASIVAPVDGVVGNRTLRVGQYVQAGTQLMTVVPTSAYIVANFKETQLTDVHAGQPVDIDVDTFPGHVYHGRVDSLAPASGQEFALLPPDNATGNFTKVVQRIPVKIVLDADSAASGDLRPECPYSRASIPRVRRKTAISDCDGQEGQVMSQCLRHRQRYCRLLPHKMLPAPRNGSPFSPA